MTKFLVEQSIDAKMAAEVELFYKYNGKDIITLIYDWWCAFISYGISKLMDKE